MWSRSWDFQSKQSSFFVWGAEGLSSINEGIFVKNVSLNSAWSSVVTQNFLSDQQWKSILVIGSLEGKGNMNWRWFSQVSDLSTDISWLWSLSWLWWKLGEEHFFVDQIDEFLVVFDSWGSDYDSVRGNLGILEVLDDVSSQVSDVALVAVKFVSKAWLTEGGSVDGVVEGLISTQMSIKLVALFVFINTDWGGNEVFRFEGAVSHHWENIDNIVRKTVGSVESRLSVEIHFELTSWHLSNTIVDSFVGVKSCFKVSVLQQ